jgi:septum site-determining protein MinD
MGSAIAFTSGKGGVGKTTVSAGVAEALARCGKKMLACDADFDLGNMDILLGMQERVYTLGDVLEGSCSLEKAIYGCESSENLFYLSASLRQEHADKLNADVVRVLLDRLKTQFDYIIIDTAAGIGSSFWLFGMECDEVILITAPYTAALRDAQHVASLLQKNKKKQTVRLVVNMVDSKLIEQGKAPDIDSVINMTGVRLIGLLPYEKKLIGLQNAGRSLFTDSKKISRQFEDIALRLCGKQIPLHRFW